MPAITDKLRRGAPSFSTTLASLKATAAASASLSSTTGVPTDTAIDFTVGRVDANGVKTPSLKAVYTATLSGTTISNLTLVEGTDQTHAAGTPVEITFTAASWNSMITWGLTQHNQDGTHGSITTTGYAQSTGTFSVPNNVITAAALATNAITLGYAQITSPISTTSTSLVDAVGLTTTVTNPAGGRRVEVEFHSGLVSNTNATGSVTGINILCDGVVIQSDNAQGYGFNSGGPITTIANHTPSVGSHTYKIQYSVGPAAATGGINAGSTAPAFLTVRVL